MGGFAGVAAICELIEERYRTPRRGTGGSDVRLRVPDEGATVVHDVIRGDTPFEHTHLDDPVIARADGSVLYNFAVAIDDLDAHITHVVLGEDHLSNTPKQLLVLEAARAIGLDRSEIGGAGGGDGDQTPLPLCAHLQLRHGPDGKKLSKRHGAASVGELRDAGYLPEALRNCLYRVVSPISWSRQQPGDIGSNWQIALTPENR